MINVVICPRHRSQFFLPHQSHLLTTLVTYDQTPGSVSPNVTWWKGFRSLYPRVHFLMAKKECITQLSTTGATSTLRNRKTFPTSVKVPRAPPKDRSGPPAAHLPEGDPRSVDGASARPPAGGDASKGPSGLLMLVVVLSFSTRLYKITEPPHVW